MHASAFCPSPIPSSPVASKIHCSFGAHRQLCQRGSGQNHQVAQSLLLLAATYQQFNASTPDQKEIHGEQKEGKGFPLAIEHTESHAEDILFIRYFYHGGKMTRDGRLIPVKIGTVERKSARLDATLVLNSLCEHHVDTQRFVPHAYDRALEAWLPLTPETRFSLAEDGPLRVDIQLFRSAEPFKQYQSNAETSASFCHIGVFGGKAERNLGTLWRSAFQFGACAVFVIGERFRSESRRKHKDKMLRVKQNLGRARILHSDDAVPLHEYQDWNEFYANIPPHTPLVAVEMGGTPLAAFEHPERAIYVLGAEDTGLPQSVLLACDYCVEVPALRSASFNVAVAGSIVLYDRIVKRTTTQEEEEAGQEEEDSGVGL